MWPALIRWLQIRWKSLWYTNLHGWLWGVFDLYVFCISLWQVYTDYPGSIGAGVALVNDLNLVVIQGRDRTGYLGISCQYPYNNTNNLDTTHPASSSGTHQMLFLCCLTGNGAVVSDNLNNVEQVQVPSADTLLLVPYVIRVVALNVPQVYTLYCIYKRFLLSLCFTLVVCLVFVLSRDPSHTHSLRQALFRWQQWSQPQPTNVATGPSTLVWTISILGPSVADYFLTSNTIRCCRFTRQKFSCILFLL